MTAPSSSPGETASASNLPERLSRLLPASAVMATASEYAVDGALPATAVAPHSREEVAAVLALAYGCAAALVPWGGGTHMALGMPPARYDLALDLTNLDRVVEYEAEDLTITVEAGMRFGELQRRLAERGQWLPLDPPHAPATTVGGVLATNASGPARISHGTARDLVIGMTVATAEGALVKSGGRVVKNVAGYDMAKMHIGALGTLGVIVQASFKVSPLPKAVRTLSAESEDVGAVLAVAQECRERGLPLTGAAFSRPLGSERARLLLRFAGSEAAVDRSSRDASEAAGTARLSLDQAPETIWQDLFSGGGSIVKISHLPSMAAEVIAQAATLEADVVSLPGAGITYARFLALTPERYPAIGRLRESIEGSGGALVLESAPSAAKREVGVWGSTRGDFALMRALKEQMDPNGILNPGRFLGGI